MKINKLKQIADLNGLIVKPEKSNKKLIFYRIFYENKVEISLFALAWNIKNENKYQRVKATTEIDLCNLSILSYNKLKQILLEDIYSQVIKNKILMI